MEEKLKKIMSQVLGIKMDEIKYDSSPDDIASWDSLQHMNLILAIEQGFNVRFDEEEIIQLLSFEIIMETINEKNINK